MVAWELMTLSGKKRVCLSGRKCEWNLVYVLWRKNEK